MEADVKEGFARIELLLENMKGSLEREIGVVRGEIRSQNPTRRLDHRRRQRGGCDVERRPGRDGFACGAAGAADATPFVHTGDNTIAVRVVNASAGRPAGLIGAVCIEFASGEPLLVQTGSHWRTIVKPEDGWQKPGFLEAAWQPAKDLGAYGMAPWGDAGFTAGDRRRNPWL